MPFDYDPFSMEFRADPYPHYARLRAEAPICWSESARMWIVSRFDDVVGVLREPALFSSDAMATVLAVGRRNEDAAPGGPPLMPGNLVSYDPPEHTRLRTIVNRAFTPRRVASWRAMVEHLTNECVDAMSQRDRFDVIADLAAQVPVRVIAEILGIDPSRHADFKRWADTLTAAMTGSKRAMDPVESGAARAALELVQHLGGVVASRSAEPSDDVISVLVRAQEGEVLTPPEVMGFAGVLTFAGTETTTNLIGNAVRVLVENDAVCARVLAQPEVVPRLLEEALRWDSPVQYVFRRATRPSEIAGTPIDENAIVCVLLGSANRDPEHWGPDAESFDLDRTTIGHAGFGFGVHFCLGAALARLEADTALRAILPLLERSSFEGHELVPIDSVQFRGVSRLAFRRGQATAPVTRRSDP
jgi:cytochrome P450